MFLDKTKRIDVAKKKISDMLKNKEFDIAERNCYTRRHCGKIIGFSFGFICIEKENKKGYIFCFYDNEYDLFLYHKPFCEDVMDKDCVTIADYYYDENPYSLDSPFYKLKCEYESKLKTKETERETNICDNYNTTKTTQKDNINPNHYKSGKYECIEEMIQMFGIEAVKNFCMCNVYKYRYRANQKNGEEDIKKAEKYMEFLMNLDEYGTVHSPETTNNK